MLEFHGYLGKELKDLEFLIWIEVLKECSHTYYLFDDTMELDVVFTIYLN